MKVVLTKYSQPGNFDVYPDLINNSTSGAAIKLQTMMPVVSVCTRIFSSIQSILLLRFASSSFSKKHFIHSDEFTRPYQGAQKSSIKP